MHPHLLPGSESRKGSRSVIVHLSRRRRCRYVQPLPARCFARLRSDSSRSRAAVLTVRNSGGRSGRKERAAAQLAVAPDTNRVLLCLQLYTIRRAVRAGEPQGR